MMYLFLLMKIKTYFCKKNIYVEFPSSKVNKSLQKVGFLQNRQLQLQIFNSAHTHTQFRHLHKKCLINHLVTQILIKKTSYFIQKQSIAEVLFLALVQNVVLFFWNVLKAGFGGEFFSKKSDSLIIIWIYRFLVKQNSFNCNRKVVIYFIFFWLSRFIPPKLM